MRDTRKTKKQLLKELEELNTGLLLLENAPHPITVIKKDTSIVYVNPAFEKLTGFSLTETTGMKAPYPWWPEETRAERLPGLEGFIVGGNTIIEEVVQNKNGERFLIELNLVQVMDNGTFKYYLAHWNDITERKQAEEALRESEERFRVASQIASDVVYERDLQTGMATFYGDIDSHLGYEPGGYPRTMEGWREHVHPEDLARIDGQNIDQLEPGVPHGIEYRMRKKDGTYMTWLDRVIVIKDKETGKPLKFIGAATDITERQQAEEALRESAEKYRSLFDNMLNGFAYCKILVDEDNQPIDFVHLEVNDAWERLIGLRRKEIIGKKVTEAIPGIKESENDLISIYGKVALTGEATQFEIYFEPLEKWFTISVYSPQKGYFVAVFENITERKQAEEALRESEEKFSKAFRASPEIIIISRLSDGTFLEVNNSFTRITGYTREETIGHTSLELDLWAKPGDREKMLKLLKEKGRVSNTEYRLRTKSGEIRTILFSVEQIEFESEPCLLTVIVDITELRKIEAQAREAETLRELDKLRTELLANISHELRTPLASIKGFATMLLDYDRRLKRDEKREYLETIDKNTDRLVELIEQLLEMSRLEAGMLSIDKAPTNIIRLCREVISEVRVRSSTHQFTLDMPAKLPRVNVDGKRIRQVLDNIIDNSVKYSDDDTEVNLAVRRKGPELLFTVTDHGIGIPRNDLPRVFNRMFHSPKKSGAVGAGLGLSICKGLVEAHGGRIWIESDEGKGTKCFFTLPLDTEKGGSHDKKP